MYHEEKLVCRRYITGDGGRACRSRRSISYLGCERWINTIGTYQARCIELHTFLGACVRCHTDELEGCSQTMELLEDGIGQNDDNEDDLSSPTTTTYQ